MLMFIDMLLDFDVDIDNTLVEIMGLAVVTVLLLTILLGGTKLDTLNSLYLLSYLLFLDVVLALIQFE